jgi:hypothetical protein
MKSLPIPQRFLQVVIIHVLFALVDGRSRPGGSLPRSKYDADEFSKAPWNPSPKIDSDGFLHGVYKRIPAVWEEELPVKGKHRKERIVDIPVLIRQVPGDGNCLFNAIIACLNKVESGRHYSFQNLGKLRRMASKVRKEAVDFLAKNPNRRLYLNHGMHIKCQSLLDSISAQFGISTQEYCEMMRKDGFWAGGPEILALCNLLRRPIHVYELCVEEKQFCLRRMSCFGSPKFDSKEAIHILSADSRFPDVHPGRHLRNGNHFLAVFPLAHASIRREKRRLRGGDTK